MMIRILAAVLLVATSAVWAVQPAAACTCVTGVSRPELESAGAALIGRVISRSTPDGANGDPMSGYVFTFEVETVVKGDISDPIVEFSSPYGSQCGIGLGAPDGERVGVLLRSDNQGGYTTYDCSGVDADVLASLALPGEVAAASSPEPPPEDTLITGDAVLASDLQASSSESLAPAAEESGSGRDIALWSAISFGGIAALLIGYAVLRKLNLRRRSTP
jgi:hypothetical protein